MPKPIRIKIAGIHERDYHYPERDRLIGLEGEFELSSEHKLSGYYSGAFKSDELEIYRFFLGVRYIKLPA